MPLFSFKGGKSGLSQVCGPLAAGFGACCQVDAGSLFLPRGQPVACGLSRAGPRVPVPHTCPCVRALGPLPRARSGSAARCLARSSLRLSPHSRWMGHLTVLGPKPVTDLSVRPVLLGHEACLLTIRSGKRCQASRLGRF